MAESSRADEPPLRLTVFVTALCMLAYAAAKWPIVTGDHGIYWPDEIYASLEMAHRRVFGYGLVPWEFVDGARNWALPLLVTVPMRLAVAIAGDNPAAYLFTTRLGFASLALLAAWWIGRGARELGAGPFASALGAGAFLLSATTLYFSHRALSENAAQLPILVGLVLLNRLAVIAADAPERRTTIVAGASALGAATLLRLHAGLVCLVAVGWIGVRVVRRRAPAADLGWALVTLAVWALAYGALDALTWGDLPGATWQGWFHSARTYWRFNAVEAGATFWGTAPVYYFGLVGLRALEALFVVLAIGVVLAARRLPLIVTALAVFVVAHSLIPHKELRFLLPVAPLAFLAASVGFSALPAGRVRASAFAALTLAMLWSFGTHRALTMRDIGAYPERRTDPAYDDFGPVNRLLLIAHAQSDLCGLQIEAPLSWTGGATYLHRRVPLYGDGMAVPEGAVNFRIARPVAGPAADNGIAPVATDGGYELRRVSAAPCVADAGYDWRLR